MRMKKFVTLICPALIFILNSYVIALAAGPPDEVYLTMEEAIERALAKNNLLRASNYDLKKAEWDRLQAWTRLLPSVTFNTRFTWIDDSTFALRDFSRYFRSDQPGPFPGMQFDIPQTVFQRSYFTSFDVSLTIFNAALWNGLSIAGQSKKLAAYQKSSAADQVVFQVISSYLNVLYVQDMLKLQKEYLELSRLNFEKAQRMHEAGRYSKMEVLRWQIDYQQQESAVANYESLLRSALTLLKRNLNMNMTERLHTEQRLPASLTSESSQLAILPDDEILGLIDLNDDQLLKANKALAAARSATEISKLTHRTSYANFLPNINLTYQYAWWENSTLALDDYSPQMLMINFSLPLFNSFQDFSGAKSSYYEYKASKARFADQLQATRYTLTETANKLINLKQQILLSKSNVEYSQRNYNIVSKQKEQGLVSNIDFIDAKLNLQNARLGEVKNHYDFISGMVELYYLTGRIEKLLD